MNTKKFYTGKYDLVFKTIMCNQEDPRLLEEFLSRLIGRKVKIVEFQLPELPVDSILEKHKVLDVFVKAEKEYFHIELNITNPTYLHQRTFCQLCKYYGNKVLKKDDYYKITEKFYVYNLVYGMSKTKQDCDIEEVYYLMNAKHVKYIDNVEFHEINMDKIMKLWYSKEEEELTKYKHLVMLDLGKEELKKLSKGDDFVEEFKEKIESLNEDKGFLDLIDAEVDARMIHNSEIHEAYDIGALEANKKNAKAMLEDHVDINLISKYTQLSIEEIEKL